MPHPPAPWRRVHEPGERPAGNRGNPVLDGKQRADADYLAEDTTLWLKRFPLAPQGEVEKVCAGVEVLTSVLLVWRPS